MSVNQSRGDKNEPQHHRRRRSGRSGNPGSPRNFNGGGGGGKGGGGNTTGPPSSAFYSGKSFKKVVRNAPGAQARVAGPNPNGAHIQQPLRGTPDAPSTGVTAKPADASVPKSTPGLLKAPQSNLVPPGSGTTGPSTPGSADASEAFPLQFGSISPGVMNGMQARLDSLKATPFPTGVSMQIPFHQSQIHLPFGSPYPPIQSQNLAASKLPLPMHLPVGNQPPQVPPQVFVPGIQHHQGIIHQRAPQLGNMGGMGMGLGPQYQQQPMCNINFGGARRTVKITHPETHEELRLDKGSDGYLNYYPNFYNGSPLFPPCQRPPLLQSQAFPPAGLPMNYYPKSYNASPLFPAPPGSNPLTSSQTVPGSQPPRFYKQVSKQMTVKQPTVSSHAEKVSASTDKSQRASEEGQPYKDSETIAGSSLPKSEIMPNTYASSAVEAEVPKKATVHPSGSFKEEQKQPDKKAHSISKVKGKRKKNMKEILKNADAYKLSEEKKETLSAAEIVDNPNSSVNSTSKKDTVLSRGPTKFEPPDDWEDAAELSALILEIGFRLKHHSEDDNDGMTKKYSRDFLLMKFSDHCTDLPEGFEISHDITELFVVTSANVACDPSPSPGRGGSDRSVAGSRLDRRPSNVGLDDKWSKGSRGPMGPGWDPNMGYPTRGNHGVLSTPRSQPTGGILPTPMQSPGPQMQLNNSDSDMWQLFYHEV